MWDEVLWWTSISSDLRKRIDDELRHRRLLPAIVLLRSDGGLEPRPGLYQPQGMLLDRMACLRDQGLVEPAEPPVEAPELIERVRSIPDPVAAVEALWDGDTYGWFVALYAIVERPGRHHRRFDQEWLAQFRRGGDLRLFNGDVPPWPEAAEAITKGQAVADSIAVPFHFTSPDTPDVDLPRWWDSPA
ncbi:hypothetical protein ACFFWC_31220 [Plantactinospora siamensis]|uniref:DUF4913 domain-containing protein n=1 Tax=Plantactinospora siamensis TaxID=555372 RepID=A0ABV6NYP8_9ACTN